MTRQRANAIADMIGGIILIAAIYGTYIAITSIPGGTP